jgi:hypothetical protein
VPNKLNLRQNLWSSGGNFVCGELPNFETKAASNPCFARLVGSTMKFRCGLLSLILEAHTMIRYSCDRCKRDILPCEELRFIVKMEIEAQLDITSEATLEDDHDHLTDLDQMLGRMEECEEFGESDFYQKRSFDLCPECYRQFAKNPLGKDIHVPLGFSKN